MKYMKIKSKEELLEMEKAWHAYIQENLEISTAQGFVRAAQMARYTGRKHRAKRLYEDAIATENANSLVYFLYGNLLEEMDDEKAAREAWRKAIEMDPLVAQYYITLAGALIEDEEAWEEGRAPCCAWPTRSTPTTSTWSATSRRCCATRPASARARRTRRRKPKRKKGKRKKKKRASPRRTPGATPRPGVGERSPRGARRNGSARPAPPSGPARPGATSRSGRGEIVFELQGEPEPLQACLDLDISLLGPYDEAQQALAEELIGAYFREHNPLSVNGKRSVPELRKLEIPADTEDEGRLARRQGGARVPVRGYGAPRVHGLGDVRGRGVDGREVYPDPHRPGP